MAQRRAQLLHQNLSLSLTLTIMSNYNYNNAPPAYQSPPKKYGVQDQEAARPLLSPVPSSSGGAFYDQPSPDDIPDDFKASHMSLTSSGCCAYSEI